MSDKTYKRRKRGGARHVQLSEALQATEAWATLKPGPRALYIELKRRFRGRNNGRLILSHRDAATALSVHRNTVGPWFAELERRGLIHMTRGAYLGPSGVGEAPLWALSELPTIDGKPPTLTYRDWREIQKPVTEKQPPRHSNSDGAAPSSVQGRGAVLKIVT